MCLRGEQEKSCRCLNKTKEKIKMNRPKVICHMTTSHGGKVMGDFLGCRGACGRRKLIMRSTALIVRMLLHADKRQWRAASPEDVRLIWWHILCTEIRNNEYSAERISFCAVFVVDCTLGHSVVSLACSSL